MRMRTCFRSIISCHDWNDWDDSTTIGSIGIRTVWDSKHFATRDPLDICPSYSLRGVSVSVGVQVQESRKLIRRTI